MSNQTIDSNLPQKGFARNSRLSQSAESAEAGKIAFEFGLDAWDKQRGSQISKLSQLHYHHENLDDAIRPDEFVNRNQRDMFSSNFDALVSMLASAIGLGNVWRFPYVCYRNGGAAFFIPYILMLVAAGLPILGMEHAWGQFTSSGMIDCWNCYPLLGGVGLTFFFINWMEMIYYGVVTAYALFYFAVSLYSLKDISDPVWEGCHHSWNTEKCFTISELKHLNDSLHKSSYSLSASEFWLNFATEDKGHLRNFSYPNWMMVIALFFTWAIVFASLCRGVRSMEKANYFFVFFPYICFTALAFGNLFFDGAEVGILMYLYPDFKQLMNPKVWAEAAQQLFFSLSLCQGDNLDLASFNGHHEQCLLNALIVVVCNCITSFWAGFSIFVVLSHMAKWAETSVNEVISRGGPSLAFISYPGALNALPGASIWGVIFFATLLTLGLGSLNSNVEACITFFVDAFPSLREKKREIAFRSAFIVMFFALGLPMICGGGGWRLLELVDKNCVGISSFISAIIMCITLSWLYGFENFKRDVATMIGHEPNWYWRITWCYSCPLVVLFVSVMWFVEKTREAAHIHEPYWATSLGWTLSFSAVFAIPLYAFYVMCQHSSGFGCQSYRALTKPNEKWGPARNEDRVGRYPLFSVTPLLIDAE